VAVAFFHRRNLKTDLVVDGRKRSSMSYDLIMLLAIVVLIGAVFVPTYWLG
jgi:hypothetical protein